MAILKDWPKMLIVADWTRRFLGVTIEYSKGITIF
jgi:hypothetical protein